MKNARFQCITLMILLVSFLATPPVMAQTSPFSKKPIGIVWDTNITQRGAMNYMQKIADEHGLEVPWGGDATAEQMERFDVERGVEKASAKGTLFYFRRGLIPSLERVGFRTIQDEKEFRKLMLNRKQMYGDSDNVVMEGNGNQYKIEYRWGRTATKNENGEEEESWSGSMITYFRCDGNIMFEADFEDLYDMDLPASKKLSQSGSKARYDSVAEFNLDEIPKGYKDIAWNTLSVQSGSMLQQRDEEDNAFYKVRRTAGDIALEVIKRGIYDLDSAGYTLNLIDEGQPLEFDVKLKPRRGSQLEKQLRDIGQSKSRFSSQASESAALTVSSAWRMPDMLTELVEAIADLMRDQIEQNSSADAELKLAVNEIADVLENTARKQKFDAFAKLDVDRRGEFVVVGGMQMVEAERLYKFLPLVSKKLPKDDFESLTETTVGDTQVITLPFRGNIFGADASTQEFVPNRLNLSVDRSTLWFSLGREASAEKLDEVIQLAAGGSRSADEQFLFDLNLEKWAAEQSEQGKLPRLALKRLEQGMDSLFGNDVQMVDRNGKRVRSKTKTETREVAGETLGLDGFGTVTAHMGRDGLHLQGKIGDGLARFFLVRYLISMNRTIKAARQRAEEAQQKIEKLKEKQGK